MHRFVATALIALLFAPLAQAEGRIFSVVPSSSSVTYKLVHKFHEIEGVTKSLEGKGLVQPDGVIKVQVRAKIESFDSGNGNRDAHMKETVEAARFPDVEFKGVASGVKPVTAFPAKNKIYFKGTLTFHGVSLPQTVELEVAQADAEHVSAEGSFPISLESFKVERPQLLFVPVDDQVVIHLKLALDAAK